MSPSLKCLIKLEITFITFFLTFSLTAIAFDVTERCSEGCRNQVNLDENDFDLACNDTCKLKQCQKGCHRWTNVVTSCQQACNDTSKVTGWVLYCILGCNHALNLYIDKIIADWGLPTAPYLVADSLSNDSLTIEWNAAPYPNITYLIQWKYESLPGDWNYYHPERPLTSSRLRITNLMPFVAYRFRVAWLLLPQSASPQSAPLMSNASVVMSTLPYGVPSSPPTITSLVAVSQTQISIGWEPPQFPNAPIVSYSLSLRQQPNGPVVVKDMPNSHASSNNAIPDTNSNVLMHCLFNNLKPDTLYTLSITTRNNFGEGPSADKNVTTLKRFNVSNSEESMHSSFDIIVANDREVLRLRKDSLLLFDHEILFRLSDYTASASISGMAVHVENKYIFVSDTSGTIRKILLKENNLARNIFRDKTRRPSTLSIDWLNDKLYMAEEAKISRCDLNGQFLETVINGFDERPVDMKVDPFNGYLFWILNGEINGGLYRVDLVKVSGQFINQKEAQMIFQEPSLTTFMVDYTNYLIYLPFKKSLLPSIYSITIDGNHPTDVRSNSQRLEELAGIENLIMHNQLFYFSKNTEMFREEYEEETNTYHHISESLHESSPIVSLKVMNYKNQPYPFPLNPVKNVQAVFLDRSAKIVWEKPDLLAGTGFGSWQNWSYELSIEDMKSHYTVIRRGLNLTDCVADELNPDTDYLIRVRGYSRAGNGSWSQNFYGKTLKKVSRYSRFPFALWGTRQGVIKSNLVGDYVEHLLHKMKMNGSVVNDITWYNDILFLNANNYVYIYNITSHDPLKLFPNITTASSVAIDWIAPKLYWASATQQMIMRSNIDGSQTEPLPITTIAKKLAIDSVKGYLYWATSHSIEAARLNGQNHFSYFQTGIFSGKYIMGLTLNMDKRVLYWLVRSFDKATLYSAPLINDINLHQVKQSIQVIGPLQDANVHGPLAYFNDRLFWIHENNDALISDLKGENLATLRGTGLSEINSMTVINQSLHVIPNGFDSLSQVVVVPKDVKPENIRVIGSWDNFTIEWDPITNINYGDVFYDLLFEDQRLTLTFVTSETKYVYPTFGQLKPHSKIKLAIRAFTFWASSKQTIVEIHSPSSIPTNPTFPRVFIYHERSAYYKTIDRIHAEFRWSPPELPNGVIRGYIVNAWSFENNQKVSEIENEIINRTNRIYLSNLKFNKTYYYKVQAFTDAGEGPASEVVEADSGKEHPVPKLLVAKTDSIILADVDSHQEKILTLKARDPISVAFMMEEKKIFWIEEDRVLKSSNVDGSNITKLHQLLLPGTSLTVDWISRRLFWVESWNFEKSEIWSYDLSSEKYPKVIYSLINAKDAYDSNYRSNPLKIGSIEIDPFSATLFWSEISKKANGFGTIMACNISDPQVCKQRQFFSQENKIGKCNCFNSVVGPSITIDRTNENNKILWIDSKNGNVKATDMDGCHCQTVINATYGLPPTSLTADNDYIYWSNSSLGNVYSFLKKEKLEKNDVKPQSLFMLHSSTFPHLILSEAVDGVRDIKTHGHYLQPFPKINCLVPLDYRFKVEMIDNTANSLKIQIPKAERPLECQNITFPSVLYKIYYGKITSDGLEECGVSLSRGCRILESYDEVVTIENLEAFTNYTVRVSVKNYFMVKDHIPGPSVTLETAESRPSPPRDVIATVETPKRILVTWEPPEKPNGDLILYEVRWFSIANPENKKALQIKKFNTTIYGHRYMMKLVGLEPATDYTITVRAYGSNDGAFFSDSEPINVSTYKLPDPIQLMNATARTILITWTSPYSTADFCEIGQHTMQYSRADQEQWHSAKSLPTEPSRLYKYTFDNLTPNSEYAFRLLLTYRSTSTLFEWSGFDSRFVFKTTPDVPEFPKKAPIIEQNSITKSYKVKWVSIINNNGAQNIFYILEALLAEDHEDDEIWFQVYNGTFNECELQASYFHNKEGLYVLRVKMSSEYGFSYTNLSEPTHLFWNTPPPPEPWFVALLIILGLLVFLLILLVFGFTVCKFQVEEKKKKALEDSRNGNNLELAPWPELPGHPHHTNALYLGNLDFDEDLAGITHLSYEEIILKRFIGRGAFGEVYEASWNRSDDLENPKSEKVAIKTLRKGASDVEKNDFIKEAKLMSNFKHPHILQLLGICLDNKSNFLILELMEEGDLRGYLQKKRPVGAIPSPLTFNDLLSICVDVAKGCKYLEDIHFVHRDLAARNCLVSCREQRIVKIGDFGLARDIYKNDYYRKEGEGLLPIRWMSPESLIDGVFTCHSDVWSFGVLLYEVMSLGQLPYHARSNTQVFNFIKRGGKLERPPNCPNDLYALMNHCWSYQREDRPTFAECLERLEDLRSRMIDTSTAITSVHNQNYILNRVGFDNPGYTGCEDDRFCAGNSLKNSTNSNCSAQTISTNLTSDEMSYQKRSSKYLELMGDSELTDADGYQIPISKFPNFCRSSDANKLLNTITQIVLKPPEESKLPIAVARRKFFLNNMSDDNSRTCSPPPTYTQVVKDESSLINGDLFDAKADQKLESNTSIQSSDKEYYNLGQSSQQTKNIDLVTNEMDNSMDKQCTSSSLSSSASSTSNIPTVAGALLKSKSSQFLPSRNLTEIKYCFDENGVNKKAVYSSQTDLAEDDNDDEAPIKTKNFHSSHNGFSNINYENSSINQINSQTKLALIKRVGGVQPLHVNGFASTTNLSFDPNTSWC